MKEIESPVPLERIKQAILLAELESKIESHDEAIRSLVSAIRQLIAYPEKPPKKIGFQLKEKRSPYLAKNRIR